MKLDDGDQKRYDKERSNLLRKGISKECADFLASHGIDPNDVIFAIENQRPFSGTKSTVSRLNAGVLDFESAEWQNRASLDPKDPAKFANTPVSMDFNNGSGTKAETGILPGGNNPNTILGRSNVFFSGGGVGARFIFHEALHSVTGFGDRNLALKLGLSPLGKPRITITDSLKAHNCVK